MHDGQENKAKNKFLRFTVDLASSAVAGTIARSLTAPLDRVKLILQTRKRRFDTSFPKQTNRNYFFNTKIVRILLSIGREQGVLGFWRGNLITIAKHVPSQSLMFGLHTYFFHLLKDDDETLSNRRVLFYSMTAGSMSAALTLAVTYPLHYCQTVISSHVGSLTTAKFSTFRDCCKNSVQNDGVRKLYQGFSPTMVSVAVNRSVYFGAYDFFKATSHSDSRIERFLVAQLSTTFAGLLSYPIETVGRRMIFDKSGRRLNMGQFALRMYSRGGFGVFFWGSLVNMLRSTSGALLLVLHDDISSYALKKLNLPKK